MGCLQIFINYEGIERTSVLSQTSDEEEQMIALYSIISDDLRSLHEKIIKHTRGNSEEAN